FNSCQQCSVESCLSNLLCICFFVKRNISMASIQVRAVRSDDRVGWQVLFEGYRNFYGFDPSSAVVDRVWNWLIDPGHECSGMLVEIDGVIVGLAHYRRFSRPSTGTIGLWLDDLFTEPTLRGQGIGRALIAELNSIAS